MNQTATKTRHSLCSGNSPAESGQILPRWQALSLHKPASLTLEAAVVIPLFLMFCAALLSFLLMLDVQVRIQSAMEETARSLGKKAYILERGGEFLREDRETASLLSVGISPVSIKMQLLGNRQLRNTVDRSRVQGGSGGLYTYASSYETQQGVLDIVVQYDYQVFWLPGPFHRMRLAQRMRSHVWTGSSLEDAEEGSGNGTGSKVYVTPTGSVYHLSPSCGYLDLSIREVRRQETEYLRNASGAKYYPCPECAAAGALNTVYITDYGTHYHASLSCSGLKRTIMEIDISEVGDMKLCSKCARGIPHTHGNR